jgi:hypothetical protein
MSEKNQQLTSVKLDKELFEQLKSSVLSVNLAFKNYLNEQSTFI